MDKVLKKKPNLQIIFRPNSKIQQMLRSANDKRNPLTIAGVYWIPCSCHQVYIGTTKSSIQTRIKEHERHCRLKQPEKSAVAKHTLKQTGHEIHFQDTWYWITLPITMSDYTVKPLKSTNISTVSTKKNV
ncbi:hypothetical protein JRQ81_019994, partial [Phrynocephalus forsythii]